MSFSDSDDLNDHPAARARQKEASEFVAMMGDLTSDLILDYSPESVSRLDQYITDTFNPPNANIAESLIRGIGCYMGEVIIAHIDGYWNPNGEPEIIDAIAGQTIYPLDKAERRFKIGASESLNWYYHTIAKHAYESSHPERAEEEASGGLMGMLKGFFGK